MQITINNSYFDFEPNFPTGWKKQNVANYLVPVTLGNYQCFVKRFDHFPTGVHFLAEVKGKEVTAIPKTYDLQLQEEDDRRILYVFQEYLPGDTLDNCIYENIQVNVKTLVEDLAEGLEEFSQRQFWYTDFCLKNIYVSEANRFYFIDIDSCLRTEVFPSVDNIVSHNFSAHIFSRLKEIKPDFDLDQLGGRNLNILQLVLLIILLKRHSINFGKTFKATIDTTNNEHLLEIFPAFDKLLLLALQEKLSILTVEEVMTNLFIDTNIELSLGQIEAPLLPLTGSTQPTIEFIVNGQSQNTIHARLKETIKLSWNVHHADETKIRVVDMLSKKYKYLNKISDRGERDFTVLREEQIIIEAIATRETGIPPLLITKVLHIYPDIPALQEPEITNFEINGKSKDRVSLPKGKAFVLTWKVKNTVKVSLNGKQISVQRKKSYLGKVNGIQKFTLIAINQEGEDIKNSLPKTIEVRERVEKQILKANTDSNIQMEKSLFSSSMPPEIITEIIPEPEIVAFVINGKSEQEIMVANNSSILISWNALHTNQVFLNGKSHLANDSSREILESDTLFELVAGKDYRSIKVMVLPELKSSIKLAQSAKAETVRIEQGAENIVAIREQSIKNDNVTTADKTKTRQRKIRIVLTVIVLLIILEIVYILFQLHTG